MNVTTSLREIKTVFTLKKKEADGPGKPSKGTGVAYKETLAPTISRWKQDESKGRKYRAVVVYPAQGGQKKKGLGYI